MGKKITALEEISDQELDQVTGGDGLGGWDYWLWRMDFRNPRWLQPQPSQGEGSCSVQDVMNDRC
jgi:hypothetical protein